jgi:hypothetical protein
VPTRPTEHVETGGPPRNAANGGQSAQCAETKGHLVASQVLKVAGAVRPAIPSRAGRAWTLEGARRRRLTGSEASGRTEPGGSMPSYSSHGDFLGYRRKKRLFGSDKPPSVTLREPATSGLGPKSPSACYAPRSRQKIPWSAAAPRSPPARLALRRPGTAARYPCGPPRRYARRSPAAWRLAARCYGIPAKGSWPFNLRMDSALRQSRV